MLCLKQRRTAVQPLMGTEKMCLRCVQPTLTETDSSTKSSTSSTYYDSIVTVIDDGVGLACGPKLSG